jgi:hypothetical protein
LHFMLACICWALQNASDVLPLDFVTSDPRVDGLRERYGDEFVADCFGRFADSDFEVHAEPATTRLRLEHFPAIQALYFDLKVRYNETEDDLFHHLFEFLRVDEEPAEEETSQGKPAETRKLKRRR